MQPRPAGPVAGGPLSAANRAGQRRNRLIRTDQAARDETRNASASCASQRAVIGPKCANGMRTSPWYSAPRAGARRATPQASAFALPAVARAASNSRAWTKRSASSAAMQPVPAAVTAWR